MKTVKNILVIFAIAVVGFSCSPEILNDEVNQETSNLRYDGGGDDDIVDETERDDE